MNNDICQILVLKKYITLKKNRTFTIICWTPHDTEQFEELHHRTFKNRNAFIKH